MKLKTIVDKYLTSIKFSVKVRTHIFYLHINDAYISKFDMKIDNNNLNEFIFFISKKYSFSTTKTIKNLINRSLKFAFENDLTKKLYNANIKLKQEEKRKPEAICIKEQCIIENYVLNSKKHYYYGIVISLYTGLRIGELLCLKWTNVDFKNRLIFINKTLCSVIRNHKEFVFEDIPKTQSSIRTIPISNFILTLFKELKSSSSCEYVIFSRNNKRVLTRSYQKSFENLLKRLKIKHYSFHSLRHTFATRLLENGVDIKTISELMGHSSPVITLNIYVHTNIDNKRKAVEKIKNSAKKID